MQATTDTPARLVLEQRPVGLSLGLVVITLATLAFAVVLFSRGSDAGVIFLCFAISPPVFAYFFLESRKLTLDRDAASVTLEFRAPRGRRGATHPLPDDAKVVLERPGPTPEARLVPPEGAPGVPLRAVLVGGAGERVALSEAYSKGPEAYRMMQAVNGWLGAE
ncbi:MAG: hypothetical protein CSA74_11725 [Rhodobacterales bacterium]|nr:MAG: hypothetical protein CSA74_11725 [Rhodobacterales bacterium]